MLLEDMTPEMFGELIDECASKHPGKHAPKNKGGNPVFVRPYVAFHRAHWRKRYHRPKKVVTLAAYRNRA
jgi:hypothetical protein